MCSGYGIAFDGGGLRIFDNDSTRNVIIFGVDNSSSSQTDISKNNFLILSEGAFVGITGSFSSPEEEFSRHFSKAKAEFCFIMVK